MKQQLRVLGIDDSPFKFKDERALVVGALVRVPNYLEGVLTTDVAVDGDDATSRIAEMISGSRYCEQIKAVMLDGIAVAGFNVIDIENLSKSLEIPVITVTRDRPDMEKMRSALEKHFPDWERRYGLITKIGLRRLSTAHKPLFACGVGLSWSELKELVVLSTVRGAIPEPLRMAHVIAAGAVRGESYGRP
jgi:endonuclease V-like protein UPF0215 family